MTGVIALLLVVASRFAWKGFREWFLSDRTPESMRRVLIVGAGEGGVYAARICQQNRRNLRLIPSPSWTTIRSSAGCASAAFPSAASIEEIPQVVDQKGNRRDHRRRCRRTKGDRLGEIVCRCANPPAAARACSPIPDEVGSVRDGAGLPRAEHVGLSLPRRGGAGHGSDPRIPDRQRSCWSPAAAAPSARKSAGRSCAIRRNCF